MKKPQRQATALGGETLAVDGFPGISKVLNPEGFPRQRFAEVPAVRSDCRRLVASGVQRALREELKRDKSNESIASCNLTEKSKI